MSIWAIAGKRHKLGLGVSLISQPFWFYFTMSSGYWGMFLVSLWHCGNQIRGLYNHWDEEL